jgi:predicted secreted protein
MEEQTMKQVLQQETAKIQKALEAAGYRIIDLRLKTSGVEFDKQTPYFTLDIISATETFE